MKFRLPGCVMRRLAGGVGGGICCGEGWGRFGD